MQKISTSSDSCHEKNRTESEGYRGVQTFIGITENNLTEVQFTREDVLEQILSSQNLNKAYKQVVSNKGNGGVDGMATEDLLTCLRQHKEDLPTFTMNIKADVKILAFKRNFITLDVHKLWYYRVNN